jgi:hypothetical protein
MSPDGRKSFRTAGEPMRTSLLTQVVRLVRILLKPKKICEEVFLCDAPLV